MKLEKRGEPYFAHQARQELSGEKCGCSQKPHFRRLRERRAWIQIHSNHAKPGGKCWAKVDGNNKNSRRIERGREVPKKRHRLLDWQSGGPAADVWKFIANNLLNEPGEETDP